MALTHGADTEKLKSVAESLRIQSRMLSQIGTSGQHHMTVLEMHWQGVDTGQFNDQWMVASQQLYEVGDRLGHFAIQCEEQAGQQDEGSAGSGSQASAAGASGMLAAGIARPLGGRPPHGRDRDNRGARGRERDTTSPPATTPAKPTDVEGYREGAPQRPEIEWDEGFEYDSRDPGFKDWLYREKWLATKDGGALLKPELDDGLDMYDHYWSNTGDPVEFDYEEAAREDSGVRSNINAEAARTAAAVDEMVADGKDGTFQITGPARGYPVMDSNGQLVAGAYPRTENWQKAIGGYQQWSSADVTVKDGMVTMEVTVHAEDHYNFNPGQGDITTGAKDEENGRFTEVGWAKPFDSSGDITRTITWPAGSPPPSLDVTDPNADPGRGEE